MARESSDGQHQGVDVKVATVAGVPVRVHWTFLLLIAALLAWTVRSRGWEGVPSSLVLMVLFFGSVLAHEVGHMLTARVFGVRTLAIVLLPIGGAAMMEARRVTPYADLWISAAGPVVNLCIAAVLLPWITVITWEPFVLVAVANLLLGLFNLIPAWPMDGGRILRAVLTELVGVDRAGVWTLLVGFGFAVLFAAMGAVLREPAIVLLALFMLLVQRRAWLAQRAAA